MQWNPRPGEHTCEELGGCAGIIIAGVSPQETTVRGGQGSGAQRVGMLGGVFSTSDRGSLHHGAEFAVSLGAPRVVDEGG